MSADEIVVALRKSVSACTQLGLISGSRRNLHAGRLDLAPTQHRFGWLVLASTLYQPGAKTNPVYMFKRLLQAVNARVHRGRGLKNEH